MCRSDGCLAWKSTRKKAGKWRRKKENLGLFCLLLVIRSLAMFFLLLYFHSTAFAIRIPVHVPFKYTSQSCCFHRHIDATATRFALIFSRCLLRQSVRSRHFRFSVILFISGVFSTHSIRLIVGFLFSGEKQSLVVCDGSWSLLSLYTACGIERVPFFIVMIIAMWWCLCVCVRCFVY